MSQTLSFLFLLYISLKKDLCFFSFPLLGPNKLTCEKEGTKERRPPYLHLLSLLLSPPTSPCSTTKLLLFPQVLAFKARLFPSYYKYFYYLPIFLTPHNQVFHTTSMSTASYLLLFFLCISLHACYARHVNPLNIKLQAKSHFSIKVCQLIYYYCYNLFIIDKEKLYGTFIILVLIL
ncbi:hypothetical protein V8G54_010385 [Vigna mungo]|uniref:Uncharacterized protein n=1 Tax=Vigna mungo TaxID=3915 RepID=A0AAQ3S5R1_VIGMU